MERLIIFPTDTVYGIGCNILDKESVEKIYTIKHRPRSKPLACLCYDIGQIKSLAYVDEREAKIIDAFMPGPLTLVLKCKSDIYSSTRFDTIGVRIPASTVAKNVLKEHGAMFTTSINESGEPPINDYDEIVKRYGDIADKIYKGNEPSSNVASTVVSLIGGGIKIIRQGEISLEAIKKVLEEE